MLSTTNILQSFRLTSSKDSISSLQPVLIPITSEAIEKASTIRSSQRQIPLSEVANHDDFSDCWIVVYDRVYSVSKFLSIHPGGYDIIMDYAGRDATLAFRGTGHSRDAHEMMKDYLVGELPEHERIFRRSDGKGMVADVPQ